MNLDDTQFLTELKALCEKATSGPWLRRKSVAENSRNTVIESVPNTGNVGLVWGCVDEEPVANSSLISAAREAIPRLIAMVEERDRELAVATVRSDARGRIIAADTREIDELRAIKKAAIEWSKLQEHDSGTHAETSANTAVCILAKKGPL